VRSVPFGFGRLRAGATRRGRLLAAATATAVLVAGCGKPDDLDAQQAAVQARQCVSLLERRARYDPKTGELQVKVGNAELNLATDEPVFAATFSDALASDDIGPDAIESLTRVRATVLSDLCEQLVRDRFGKRIVDPLLPHS
jgi:hypothetical protein